MIYFIDEVKGCGLSTKSYEHSRNCRKSASPTPRKAEKAKAGQRLANRSAQACTRGKGTKGQNQGKILAKVACKPQSGHAPRVRGRGRLLRATGASAAAVDGPKGGTGKGRLSEQGELLESQEDLLLEHFLFRTNCRARPLAEQTPPQSIRTKSSLVIISMQSIQAQKPKLLHRQVADLVVGRLGGTLPLE